MILEWPADVPEHHPAERQEQFHFTQPVTGEELTDWRAAWESFVLYGTFPWAFSAAVTDPMAAELLGVECGQKVRVP